MTQPDACARWEADLRGWTETARRLPGHGPRMPDAGIFRQRAEWALRRPLTPSHLRALEVFPEGGVVLDVGAGAGAGSLPIGSRAPLVVGVDRSDAMLDAFRPSVPAARPPDPSS